MHQTIAALIAEGAGMAARPRNDAAESDKGRLMNTNARAEQDSSAPERQEPNHTGIKLYGHDISDDSEGELVAVYSPLGGAMDGQIVYARPRDFVSLEDAR